MPSLSNIQLALQHNGRDLSRNSQRRVSVSFTTNFSATEMFAHVVYRADVILRSQGDQPDVDNTSTRIIGTRVITSAAAQVQTTITTSLHREELNEDPDYLAPNREVPLD